MANQDIQLLGSRTGAYYGDLNDVEYDIKGNILMISGVARARQGITKILLTSLGTQPFPNYGSSLSTLAPNRLTSTTQNSINSTILSALAYYNQTVLNDDPAVVINQVVAIDIQFVGTDTFSVNLQLSMADGSTLTIALGS